ncbi:MAG: glutathione transferase GstA [Alphaproteobacteria bacterium]|nr:glutathione transferase GstA [Alphaproteobacteria bacterium]
MKLYYSPGACSLSPHIVLREAGYDFDMEKVDLKTKLTQAGEDFNKINEKSAVPVLMLDNGEIITEGPAIVQYLADQKPGAGLAPKNGTIERVRLQEWLNYISTELHKTFGPLFAPVGHEATVNARKKLEGNFAFLERKLKDRKYLMGDQFTVADAYLFTILSWTKFIQMDLATWPVLAEYQKRVSSRPKVQETLKAEGLA